MHLLWDLLQAAGVAAAIGIRPFLPVLLVGALASARVGVGFQGTDFAFLAAWPFLLAVVLALVALNLVVRRAGPAALEHPRAVGLFGAVAIALGAAEGGGITAHHKDSVVLGCVLGAASAALAYYTALGLLTRTRRRLDGRAAAILPLYAEAASLVITALAIFAAPLSLAVIAALIWLLLAGKRRGEKKYAGLRILR